MSAQASALFERFGVNLLAVSRSGNRPTGRLGTISLEYGDLIVLQGNLGHLPERLKSLDCLPLAEQTLQLGKTHRALLPVFILIVAMALTALKVSSVPVIFFGAAVLLLSRAVTLRLLYQTIEWPIIVMLAALIPVSDSLSATGATELIAHGLSGLASDLSPYGALCLILVTAMLVTPFLNNAATVLVMAPIAVSFSRSLGYTPDAFLMAVAIRAGCDFLTPIGHQGNTLVMGLGGYRFSDYSRLGAPPFAAGDSRSCCCCLYGL